MSSRNILSCSFIALSFALFLSGCFAGGINYHEALQDDVLNLSTPEQSFKACIEGLMNKQVTRDAADMFLNYCVTDKGRFGYVVSVFWAVGWSSNEKPLSTVAAKYKFSKIEDENELKTWYRNIDHAEFLVDAVNAIHSINKQDQGEVNIKRVEYKNDTALISVTRTSIYKNGHFSTTSDYEYRNIDGHWLYDGEWQKDADQQKE